MKMIKYVLTLNRFKKLISSWGHCKRVAVMALNYQHDIYVKELNFHV